MSDQKHFDIDEFVAEANRWDDLYLHSTIHAVELYHVNPMSEKSYQTFSAARTERRSSSPTRSPKGSGYGSCSARF